LSIKVNGKAVEKRYFPGGEYLLDIDCNPLKNSDRKVLIRWDWEPDEEYLLYTVVKHLKAGFPGNDGFTLYMPYAPHARMDKTYSYSEVKHLEIFVEFINNLQFDKVIIRDIHNPNTLDWFRNSKKDNNLFVYLHKTVEELSEKHDKLCICLPDRGASCRYTGIEFFDKYPLIVGDKVRDPGTGRIRTYRVMMDFVELNKTLTELPLMGKTVLIVDDICSYGGTFALCAEKLRELGASHVYLYVTHCEDSILDPARGLLGSPKFEGLVDRVYTTPSILHKMHDKIIQYPELNVRWKTNDDDDDDDEERY